MGWSKWNTDLYPEKLVFARNQEPAEEMNPIGALYDEDGLPKYILHSDGHIEKRMVNESIKKTIYAVMKTRLDRDYPVERKVSISMLIINESGSTNPEVLEFKRRVKEVDDLKV